MNPPHDTRSNDLPALSRLSLGCATFGREIDQAAANALMDHAASRGMTHFDTASGYSAGTSERIVGAWLASRRPAPETAVVATKVAPPYTPSDIDRAVATSAARLGVDIIDLLYLHKWDAAIEITETLATLDRLVRVGRVRALGASNFTTGQLAAALARQSSLGFIPFRFVQNNQNLAVRDIDDAMRDLCHARGIAIVTYSPLGAGYLTGKHRAGVKPGSRFAVMPGHQDIYFQPTAARRLERLAALSEQTGQSMTHLALVWALHQSGITSTLIGGRSTAHIDQAFTALAIDDKKLLAALNAC